MEVFIAWLLKPIWKCNITEIYMLVLEILFVLCVAAAIYVYFGDRK